MKTVTVSFVPGLKYQQKVDGGSHSVICDIDAASGGDDGGLDPKQLVLGGLGSCMAMTIMMVASHKKWDIQSLSIKLTQTDEPDPANAGKRQLVIAEEIEVHGNLTQKELDDIKATSQKCPVYKLMTEPKRMETTVKLATPPSQGGGAPGTP
jgi:putative redox protein